LLGEALTLRQGIGGALALAGIYLCLRSNGGTDTIAASEGVTP
jgi:drug/metabolite transporter (DMT)-like permease